MQKFSIFISLLFTIIVTCDARGIETQDRGKDEARFLFGQIIESSGLFPIEMNVPDTIAAMYGGMMSTYAFMQGYLGNGDSAGDAGQAAASEAIKQPETEQQSTSAAESDDKSPSSAAAPDSQEFSSSLESSTTIEKPDPTRRRSKKNKKRSKLTMTNFLRLANILFT